MSNNKEMSFLSHLEELRWHVVRIAIAWVVTSTITFFFAQLIIDRLLLQMLRPEFITFDILNRITENLGLGSSFAVPTDGFKVQNTRVFGQFNVYLMVSLIAGIILVFPYILWEIWRFLKPALTMKEQQYAGLFVASASTLFMFGIFFGFYIISPMALHFGYTFRASDYVENNFQINNIISTITTTTLSMGLVFLIPIIFYFLTKTNLISPQFLRTHRRYALIIIMVLAAAITPADIFSMLVAAVPLLGLYEFSIIISSIVYRKQNSSPALRNSEH